MKNLWLHAIYLSIIGVLGFQLWSKTAETRFTLNQVAQVLKSNNEVLRINSEYLLYEIEKEYSTNTEKYGHLITSSKANSMLFQSASNIIDKFEKKVELNESINVNSLRDSLSVFSKKLGSIEDKLDSSALIKGCSLIKIIQNDTFWKSFMSNPSTNFLLLKNQIKLDELVYLNYFLDKVSGKVEIDDSWFHVVIAPKKAVLIEGEEFEAEIFLSKYNTNPGTGLSFTINNQNLAIKDGVAKYSKTEKTLGLKTLKVNASIRNPATGEIIQRIGEFEYHVLPKCSQNCQ